jgi:DNA-binding MarR family transcriptional regulator
LIAATVGNLNIAEWGHMGEQEKISLIDSIIRRSSILDQRRISFIDNRLKETGLKGTAHQYIIIISRHPGANQDTIAEVHGVDKSRVARIAGKLESLGYIRREEIPENRRSNQLFLTEAGEEVLTQIRDALREWGEIICGDMETEEIILFNNALKKIMTNTEAASKGREEKPDEAYSSVYEAPGVANDHFPADDGRRSGG